jgi:hypothetical protein
MHAHPGAGGHDLSPMAWTPAGPLTTPCRSARRTMSSNSSFLRRCRITADITGLPAVARGAAAGGSARGAPRCRGRAQPRRPDLNGPRLVYGCAAELGPIQQVLPLVATAREPR